MTPMVSICIPTFRRLSYLKEAVLAAQVQTLRNIEVLISDDGDCEELKTLVRERSAGGLARALPKKREEPGPRWKLETSACLRRKANGS